MSQVTSTKYSVIHVEVHEGEKLAKDEHGRLLEDASVAKMPEQDLNANIAERRDKKFEIK
jgi:hypothetical protein